MKQQVVIFGAGQNADLMKAARAEKYTQAKAKGYNLITYVSSRSATWPGLVIGDNCRIHEGAVIQPFAEIGNNVIIGSGSVICHHTFIREHCFIAGGATVSGNVTVEPFCFIGAGAATVRRAIRLPPRPISTRVPPGSTTPLFPARGG